MVGYLLDTHAALFWWSLPRKLGRKARDVIEDPTVTVAVSAATAWEIALKFRMGKLPDIGDPSTNYARLMKRDDFLELAVTSAHALRSGLLPGAHGDPFDRLIAAQGIVENLTVVTRDPQIAAFGCETLW